MSSPIRKSQKHPLLKGRRLSEFDRDLLEATATVPELTFFFTLDQVASMLSLTEATLREKYIYFVGLEPLRRTARKIKAVNIAPGDMDDPDWRVEEKEFRRFVKAMRLRLVESYAKS